MSFLPAEEYDDYDSDDGFTGEEDFLKTYLNIQNFESSKESPSHADDRQEPRLKPSNFEQTRVTPSASSAVISTNNEPRRQFGARSTPGTNGFGGSSYRFGQPFYSEEDFKMAAIKGNVELVKNCLNQGMSVCQPFSSGWTALMYASNNAKPTLVEFLLEEGADATCHSDMYTALMCACSATSHSEEDVLACAIRLIDAGADINAKDRYHSTPLMLASRAGKVETVKVLLQRGAKINDQDSRGWTALTMATQKCYKAVVMTLLDAGADCDIQHRDKLTVKDLAAHLPTDEMLALLERRPFIASTYGDVEDTMSSLGASSHCLLDAGDASMKSTDLRYGELELFLFGLELQHLLPLFRKQLIDLPLLLTLTEQDLTNAGVEQVGARKKLLEASQAVHKRTWEASSLVSIHFNKCISCADAVAMIANISKHLRYVASTATYVKEQIRRHPETVMQPTDRVNTSQLMRHVEDSMKNVVSLKGQLAMLQSQLKKQMSKHRVDPADLISFDDKKPAVTSPRLKSFTIVCLTIGAFSILLWKRDRLLDFVK